MSMQNLSDYMKNYMGQGYMYPDYLMNKIMNK
jgi:hypothetical protein